MWLCLSYMSFSTLQAYLQRPTLLFFFFTSTAWKSLLLCWHHIRCVHPLRYQGVTLKKWWPPPPPLLSSTIAPFRPAIFDPLGGEVGSESQSNELLAEGIVVYRGKVYDSGVSHPQALTWWELNCLLWGVRPLGLQEICFRTLWWTSSMSPFRLQPITLIAYFLLFPVIYSSLSMQRFKKKTCFKPKCFENAQMLHQRLQIPLN